MKRIFTFTVIFLTAILLSGCIEVDTTVNLNKDGSGTIEEKVLMSSAMISMLKQFSQSFSNDSTKKEAFNIYDPKELESKASTYGNGVKFVSGEKIKDGDREGFKAIYSFTDINKLMLDQNPGSQVPMGSDSQENKDKDLFTFNFTKGSPAKLEILMPKEKFDKEKNKEEEDTTGNNMGDIAKVKQMFKDMKVEMNVKVNGKIVSTNATYVNGSNITLFKVDFNDLLDNPEKLKEMQTKNPQNIDEFRKLVKGVKGIQMEFNDKVNVEFE